MFDPELDRRPDFIGAILIVFVDVTQGILPARSPDTRLFGQLPSQFATGIARDRTDRMGKELKEAIEIQRFP